MYYVLSMFPGSYSFQLDRVFVSFHVSMKGLYHMFIDIVVDLGMTMGITLNFYFFPLKLVKVLESKSKYSCYYFNYKFLKNLPSYYCYSIHQYAFIFPHILNVFLFLIPSYISIFLFCMFFYLKYIFEGYLLLKTHSAFVHLKYIYFALILEEYFC